MLTDDARPAGIMSVPLSIPSLSASLCDTDMLPNSPDDAGVRLPQQDRARIDKLVDPDVRRRRLASAASVYRMFGDLLGTRPEAVSLAHSDQGAPYLSSMPGAGISISRSENWTATAYAQSGRVGIDIERDRVMEWRPMLSTICAPDEAAAFLAAAGQDGGLARRAFFRLWTAKEAVLKATQQGFGFGPRTIRLPISTLATDSSWRGTITIDDSAFALEILSMGELVVAVAWTPAP
ncbi:4'-phosphopantetheinyl transferase family protein [Hyphomonas johnsonii]|uniref:4'-phosphopantetheinyl transferase n=1 Tax=Hyphomonas johnsonii MHS-2 TaxID=1280950 RepID=A0A059FUD1_9PROT|nr:4'-phosphopantetheinyl transferase superfamily protein [Hyphomonas johnsonii]KCZ94289.1 4'-phosphopantetheinyl transferase [Hyphomonas johnsonii MHS-2]